MEGLAGYRVRPSLRSSSVVGQAACSCGSQAMERCDGRGVGEPQLMLDRGTSVIFVMSRVVLRDAGVHLAAIAMALKLAFAGLDNLCYRLGCRRGNKSEIALK